MYYILNDQHIPIPVDDMLVWARWFEGHRDERVVRQETVGNFWVSTVFLAIDHSFAEGGPPILFETMVFGPDGQCQRYSREDSRESFAERCTTWELALEMHARGVRWARGQLS